MPTFAPSRLVIHPNLLTNNLEQVRAAMPGKTIIAVVKANAYGHGLREVVSVLKKQGVTEYAVAFVSEAIELRRLVPSATIHVLHKIPVEAMSTVRKLKLLVTAHALDDVERFLAAKIPFQIKIDTGMTRLGLLPEDLPAAIALIKKAKRTSLAGVWTHFASAEDKKSLVTVRQRESFREAVVMVRAAGITIDRVHAQNSAGIWHLQLNDLVTHVRPGLALYGYGPTDREPHGLEPIATWETKIVQLKQIAKGKTVGYGATFRAPKPLLVATIPVGYNDGVNRLLSNQGSVLVRSESGEEVRCRILGRVSMDSTVIDVTDVPGVAVGDRVTLIGRDKAPTAWEWAAWCKTIPYEITCRIGTRVERVTADRA